MESFPVTSDLCPNPVSFTIPCIPGWGQKIRYTLSSSSSRMYPGAKCRRVFTICAGLACECRVLGRRCWNHQIPRRLCSWPYSEEAPLLCIYLIDPRAGQRRANMRHLLTVCHSIFWVRIHRKVKPHFLQPNEGGGVRHLNNGLAPWLLDRAQSYLVMYGAGNNYLSVHLFSGLWVTGHWIQIWSEESCSSIIFPSTSPGPGFFSFCNWPWNNSN